MAIYHDRKNNLESEYEELVRKSKKYSKYSIICIVVAVALILLNSPLAFLGFVGVALCFVKSGSVMSKANVLAQGIEGEANTRKLLSVLPDTYHVIPNAEVVYEGKHSEMDSVIVGNNGVFIVETKNKVGRIYGVLDEHDWTQEKTSRGGNVYTDEFYNPAKQVATHVYRLSGFLKQNGVHTWVQGMVFFSSAEGIVDITAKGGEVKTPVFSIRNELVINRGSSTDDFRVNIGTPAEYLGETNILKYIANHKKQTLTPAQVEKIVGLLL